MVFMDILRQIEKMMIIIENRVSEYQ